MQVGWIDFSPEERSRTLTVLSTLNQPGSIDELGIGIVRDRMADLLFPATSTLLTRARYFFFVPYISRYLEEQQSSERKDPRLIRNTFTALEHDCAVGLLQCNKDEEGIIGSVTLSSNNWVTRGPGEIYWASLRSLGFMKDWAPDSLSSHFSYLADAQMRMGQSQYEQKDKENDNGLADDSPAFGSMWNPPYACYKAWRSAWNNWKNEADINLSPEEASYLQARIIESHPESLYSLLLTDDDLREYALAILYKSEGLELGDSSFHTFLRIDDMLGLELIRQNSRDLARICELADDFSEFVSGCRIAYNMQLPGPKEEAERKWEIFSERAEEVAQRLDIDAITDLLGLRNHSGMMTLWPFLTRAQKCMLDNNLEGLMYEVRQREITIKGPRRKIGKSDAGNYAWRGGNRLPYRFNYAMSIIREIREAGERSA